MLRAMDGGPIVNRFLDELLGFIVIGSMAIAWAYIVFYGATA